MTFDLKKKKWNKIPNKVDRINYTLALQKITGTVKK